MDRLVHAKSLRKLILGWLKGKERVATYKRRTLEYMARYSVTGITISHTAGYLPIVRISIELYSYASKSRFTAGFVKRQTKPVSSNLRYINEDIRKLVLDDIYSDLKMFDISKGYYNITVGAIKWGLK